MAITLTTDRCVPSCAACWRNAWPLLSGPLGKAGIVTETTSAGLFASSWLMASRRKLLVAVSAMAAPSMSKSMWFTCSVLITDW